jgi:hypothetical protein
MERLTLKETAKIFFEVAVPFCIPMANMRVPVALYPRQ